MLSDGRGRVLKPMLDALRGAREAAFYARLAELALPPPAAGLFPRFFGVVAAPGCGPGGGGAAAAAQLEHLALEDVTACFRRPSVMDVKVGTRTFGDDASEVKAAAEISKYPLQAEVGLRITGMRVYEGEGASGGERAGEGSGGGGGGGGVSGEYRVLGRAFGLGLRDRAALVSGFSEFLCDSRRRRVRAELVAPLLRRVREIEAWVEAQREFRFIGSSLLFVYEGSEAQDGEPGIDVRLIDFAHTVLRTGARDDGMLVGLRSVVEALLGVAAA